ncbi:MAG: lactoylglutathione lyase [Myxococcota bacterium]|jgi:lactoylglutathione lyase
MKLGYTIIYVDNVEATIARFETAFGLTRKFVTPEGDYGELLTGETTLSFAEREFGRSHFTDPVTRASFDGTPNRFELGFVTEDVQAAWDTAVASGFVAVVSPIKKSWGQIVGWVRDPEGILVELASAME